MIRDTERFAGSIGIMDLVVASVIVVFLGAAGAVFMGELAAQKVSAMAPLVIAAVTLAYAYLTYKLVVETRRGRREQVKPKLRLETDRYSPKLVNYGQGPAIDLSGTLSFLDDGPTKNLKPGVLRPGDIREITAEEFAAVVDESSAVHRKYDTLRIDVDWKDILDNPDNLTETYETEALISEADPSSESIENVSQELGDVVTELEKIKHVLDADEE